MKKPKIPETKLPYASAIASFWRDAGERPTSAADVKARLAKGIEIISMLGRGGTITRTEPTNG